VWGSHRARELARSGDWRQHLRGPLRAGRQCRSPFGARFNPAAQNCTVLNGEASTHHASFYRSTSPYLHLVASNDAPEHRAKHHDALGGNVRTNRGVWPDGENVIGQIDASVHLTVDGQIFGARYFSFYADGSSQLRRSNVTGVSGLTDDWYRWFTWVSWIDSTLPRVLLAPHTTYPRYFFGSAVSRS